MRYLQPLLLASLILVALAVGCRHGEPLPARDGPGPVPLRRLDVPATAQARLDPALRAPWQGHRTVLVDLVAQVDLERLGAELTARGASKAERRRVVVEALEAVAAAEQRRLAPLLAELEASGEVTSWEGFAVVDRLIVRATKVAVDRLAARPEVAFVGVETALAPEAPGDRPSALAGASVREPGVHLPPPSWALDALGVEAARARGLDGSGVVVGIIDSGASARHRELADSFRGGRASWLDAAEGRPEPHDGAYGHGTGVLACAVGSTVGVAPGARWAACAAFPDGRFDNVRLTRCADWMVRTVRPDVLINAWSVRSDGCDRSVQPIVDAWRAAEILPIFAAGNTGPEPGANRSPANLTGLYPGDAAALAVGGFGPDGRPYDRSAAGPGACGDAVFPTLAAPAAELPVPLPVTATAYRLGEGTSYAAGYTAGVAAVLLQAVPEATVLELEAALTAGAAANPPGSARSSGRRFGHGRLHLPGALRALERRRTGRRGTPHGPPGP